MKEHNKTTLEVSSRVFCSYNYNVKVYCWRRIDSRMVESCHNEDRVITKKLKTVMLKCLRIGCMTEKNGKSDDKEKKKTGACGCLNLSPNKQERLQMRDGKSMVVCRRAWLCSVRDYTQEYRRLWGGYDEGLWREYWSEEVPQDGKYWFTMHMWHERSRGEKRIREKRTEKRGKMRR